MLLGEPIFIRLRRVMGVRYNEINKPYGDTFLSDLFSCIYCMSRWVGGFVTIGYFLFGVLFVWLMLPFALSTVVFLIKGDE